MYYVEMDGLLYLRCPGLSTKHASHWPGVLAMKNIKRFKQGTGIGYDPSGQQVTPPLQSQNPLLRGIPATSARQASPLVVTMGTTGV